ncbi:hypothetical protein [Streptomyces canus]|uniref:hypothetical protein n=1 Tax=Streptomyces canus TaxID=58343 RepID=UPI003CF899D9
MIAYVFLALGCGGTAAVAYAVAPAGRGLHRYVMPRAKLRALAERAEADANRLAAELCRACDERDEALGLLAKAEVLVADLEAQLSKDAPSREAVPAPSPADDISALADEAQEFVDTTPSAWRARA